MIGFQPCKRGKTVAAGLVSLLSGVVMKKLFAAAMFAMFTFCVAGLTHAAPSVGLVLTVQPGAWVERGGEKISLTVKSKVQVGDILLTDATGRAQIIFVDDTTISLGSDTRVSIADFVFAMPGKKTYFSKKPSFSVRMTLGVARFVTGKVVGQNRKGFSVSTPQATMGIRGTTFIVEVKDEMTSVTALNITPGFPITVTNLATDDQDILTRPNTGIDVTRRDNGPVYNVTPGRFSQFNLQGTTSGKVSPKRRNPEPISKMTKSPALMRKSAD